MKRNVLGKWGFNACFIVAIILALLTGCNSSSSSSSSGDQTSGGISGVAATGAPIAGVVNVVGANGNAIHTNIALDGTYSFSAAELSSITAPYMLWAKGTVGNETVEIYSTGVAQGSINITPITDFILRKALKVNPADIVNKWAEESSRIDAQVLADAEAAVRQQFAPILKAAGLNEGNVDIMGGKFKTDLTGMDAVLESVTFSYDATGKQATIQNKITGKSFTDDVESDSDDSNGFPDSDASDTGLGMADLIGINTTFKVLENLYANGSPTGDELNAKFAPLVAEEFLLDGKTKKQELDQWIVEGDGPDQGIKFLVTIEKPFDLAKLQGEYVRAYWVNVSASVEGKFEEKLKWAVVYDGENWLWLGNLMPLEIGVESSLRIIHPPGSQKTLYSGLFFVLDDEANYAFDRGLNVAVIKGPGFPEDGVVMVRNGDDASEGFSFLRLNGPGVWPKEYIFTDNEIESLPETKGTYQFELYEETAPDNADLNWRPSSANPSFSFESSYEKRPIKVEGLSDKYFAELISPLNTDNLTSNLTIKWKNPEIADIDEVGVGLGYGPGYVRVEKDVETGATEVTFDLSNYMPLTLDSITIDLGIDDDVLGVDVLSTWILTSEK